MTAAEETLLLAYFRDQPWGDSRADVRSAQIAQILWNKEVKKEHRRKITDFMPFFRRSKTTEPEEGLEDNIKQQFLTLMDK